MMGLFVPLVSLWFYSFECNLAKAVIREVTHGSL